MYAWRAMCVHATGTPVCLATSIVCMCRHFIATDNTIVSVALYFTVLLCKCRSRAHRHMVEMFYFVLVHSCNRVSGEDDKREREGDCHRETNSSRMSLKGKKKWSFIASSLSSREVFTVCMLRSLSCIFVQAAASLWPLLQLCHTYITIASVGLSCNGLQVST